MTNHKQKVHLALGLLIVFIAALTATIYLYPSNTTVASNSSSMEILGSTSYGNVLKEGPFGNINSTVKIAVIVGVHPLESDSHQAMVESIKSHSSNLNYSYTIYNVNVTENADKYNKGRMNGQLLANKYAVPDIENHDYQLAIDVHSNVGNWAKNRFIFSPVNGSSAESIAMNITGQLPWLSYYVPPNTTSTVYVTVPLINAGIPAVVYESYHNDSYETVKNHANDFLLTVDNLKI
jgi:hypothetical protein